MQSTLGAEVDVRRIGLWGTSFAGGHVLVTAAKEGINISAVVSQVGPALAELLHAVLLSRQADATVSGTLMEQSKCFCTLSAGAASERLRGFQAESQEQGHPTERAPVSGGLA